MTPGFGTVLFILLMVCGIYWCGDVFGRLHKDLATFRETDEPAERFAIVFWWVVTALLLIGMCYAMWIVFGRIYATLHR